MAGGVSYASIAERRHQEVQTRVIHKCASCRPSSHGCNGAGSRVRGRSATTCAAAQGLVKLRQQSLRSSRLFERHGGGVEPLDPSIRIGLHYSAVRLLVPKLFVFLFMLHQLQQWQQVSAHVRLVYPPSRNWNDYLLSQEVSPPCGVQHTRNSPTTLLRAGMLLNVSWAMSAIHSGGYRIELLSSSSVGDGAEPLVLVNRQRTSTWGADMDPTIQWDVVWLPNQQCLRCTIRLVKQALEIGENEAFISCADVNIITYGINQCHQCRGLPGIGCMFDIQDDLYKCGCPSNGTLGGVYCEKEDECLIDSDCGGPHAHCMQLHTTNPPSRQCFCDEGYFGPECQFISDIYLPAAVDLTAWEASYPFRVRASNFTMYWRVIPAALTAGGGGGEGSGEDGLDRRIIEVAVAADTMSYVAVGWRPAAVEELKSRQVPDTDPAEAVDMNSGVVFPPLLTGPKLLPTPENKAAAQWLARTGRTRPQPTSIAGLVYPQDGSLAHLFVPPEVYTPVATQRAEAKAMAMAAKGGRRRLAQVPTVDSQTSLPEGEQSSSTREETVQAVPEMLWQDMTIIAVRGRAFRVIDAYALNHGTPQDDRKLPGGTSDIIDAIAHEEDGRTFAIFRRFTRFLGEGAIPMALGENAMSKMIWATSSDASNNLAYHFLQHR
ncbi:hypothetical protein CBR_g70877 [Chara braunii]|uniref:EGF-like domain-containing protein n=1 Tax=Chara braunii TaxID=69332 RepID=A0A388MFX7_CHABU|nr:hypothetical protein CBR_g70877 [Chara braunii]|eukprot:GBG93461.1 hypothetical protein CBR_g70877 [Chara braunii]